MGKSLVIDASIARSCGDQTATYPTSVRCRDFLIETQANQHRIVLTADINAEWNKHKSRFARQWLGSMIARKQFTKILDLPIDPELWDPIEELAKDDGERAAMTKDILLLEAALATDRAITSLDEKTARKFFTLAAKTIPKLRSIVWVNPDKPEEIPIEWLREGAPADEFRMLGNAE
ncbi:MAG: hypothetical protein HC860_13460 [Alkalinema sp. RU_4_3]|nr:hypothetical protein [Alkalinema sp. RU_4_3]